MLRKIKGFVLLATLLSPAILTAQVEPTLPDTLPDPQELLVVDYAVRPGDEITIRVFTSAGAQLGEVSGTRLVDPNGILYLPYVGTLDVSGLTTTQIRERIEAAYARLYDSPVVDVVSRVKVNITGSVRAPGHYLLDPSSTLIDALASAGGVGSEIDVGWSAASDPSTSRFVRNGELFVLDLRPDTDDPTVFSTPVQSGDWIHVPIASRSQFREKVQFWGGVVSLVTSTVALFILMGK